MSRRTLTSAVATCLLVVLFAVAWFLPVPYVTFTPGPTVNVLAENHGNEIVSVSGKNAPRAYHDNGQIRLTTVSVTAPGQKLGLLDAMRAWFDPGAALYPRDAIYDPNKSTTQVEQRSSVQMVSSQDTAVAVALTELGYDLTRTTEVYAVTKGAPAQGKLKVRDRILAVNGKRVSDTSSVSAAVQESDPGKPATFTIGRGGTKRTLRVPTTKDDKNPDRAVVGIVVGPGYRFPFDVNVDISDNIGGPSAGLIFSIGVYDTLTPGSLTDGDAVAGTGTIDADGKVGPIGGIQQKILGAEQAGAGLFLVPPGNCDEALDAPVDETDIRLVKAPTMHSAVKSLKAWTKDHDADLPACG